MCVCVFVGISSRIYAFFFCKHKELFSFSQQITAVGPVPPLLCVCLCVGGCCLQETFARTTIVLFVCFYTFNVYLILFCVLFSHRLTIIFSVFSLSSSFSQSINAKHDSRNAIFYLLAAFLFLFCFLELLCFFHFLNVREIEKL